MKHLFHFSEFLNESEQKSQTVEVRGTKYPIVEDEIFIEFLNKVQELEEQDPSLKKLKHSIKFIVYRTPRDMGISPEKSGAISTGPAFSIANGKPSIGRGRYLPVQHTHKLGIAMPWDLYTELESLLLSVTEPRKIKIVEETGEFGDSWLFLWPHEKRGLLAKQKFSPK